MRRLAFLLAFFVTCAASARSVLDLPTADDSHVKIKVECCYSEMPPGGFAPVDITINNSSGHPQTWKFTFSSPNWERVAQHFTSTATVTVEPGATRTSSVLVPLATASTGSSLAVEAEGLGVTPSREVFTASSRNGRPPGPCQGLSEGVAGKVEVEKFLGEAANVEGKQSYCIKSRADELPADWRAYSGLAGLWLLDSEWQALSPAQRTAVEDWIAAGGRLFLCAESSPAPVTKSGLGLTAHVNLGLLRGYTNYPWREETKTQAAFLKAQLGEMQKTDCAELVGQPTLTWKTGNEVGALRPNFFLLISFLAVFAITVGPANIFYFARSGRRSRLFWTVPVISFGASALLMVVIVIQDGFGGWGYRNALVCLVPAQRKAVVFQEQISKTGVVGGSAFSMRDPVWMTMIDLEVRFNRNIVPAAVQIVGNRFSGEWFKSRTVQAQWLESIIPTRAEVTLMNPKEASEGRTAPAVVSSIAANLQDLWYWDANGKCWHGGGLRTGEKAVLSAEAPPRTLFDDSLESLRRRLEAVQGAKGTSVQGAKGTFVAVTTDSSAFIETLPSIRWKNRHAIFTGPVTGAIPTR